VIERRDRVAPAPDAYAFFGLTPDKVAQRVTDFMQKRGMK
jgi:hypothetical protein